MPNRFALMSGEEGYTTAEALAALAILGLAMAGLMASFSLIRDGQARAQGALRQSVVERAATDRLERILARGGPYRSDQVANMVGDGSSLSFDCGAVRCGARLDQETLILKVGDGPESRLGLPTGDNPHFVYLGTSSQSENWPSAPLPPPGPSWQRLEAVLIQGGAAGGNKPLVVARVWRQQRADCEYDVVTEDCRGEGP